jgi:hypothetical protein
MMALVLADMALLNMGRKMEHLKTLYSTSHERNTR